METTKLEGFAVEELETRLEMVKCYDCHCSKSNWNGGCVAWDCAYCV